MDDLDTLTRVATSVLRGGAAALRAEGPKSIQSFRKITDRPIIGMVKVKTQTVRSHITSTFAAAKLFQKQELTSLLSIALVVDSRKQNPGRS